MVRNDSLNAASLIDPIITSEIEYSDDEIENDDDSVSRCSVKSVAGTPLAADLISQQPEQKISIFDFPKMEALCLKNDIKLQHLYKVVRFVIQKGTDNFRDIPDIPQKYMDILTKNCAICTARLVDSAVSKDGSTTKLLIALQNGREIESVIMRYGQVELETFPEGERKPDSGYRCHPRSTLCVSSQVGCAMGCNFCATGTMGLLSNLTCGEIVEQLFIANKLEPIRNVVFMGMGEPLDNYNEVVAAIRIFIDVRAFRLAAHHVTLSTVGVVPRLRDLKNDLPEVCLALSLHAPNQSIRETIVPSAKAWDIHDILDAASEFVEQQSRRNSRASNRQHLMMLEYVMIQDINCSVECAKELLVLLGERRSCAHLNLIPYNPILGKAAEGMKAPSQVEIDSFAKIIREGGVPTTVRQTLGQDIGGACGQLVVKRKCGDKIDIEESVSPKRSNGLSNRPDSSDRTMFTANDGSNSPTEEGNNDELMTLFGVNANDFWSWLQSPSTIAGAVSVGVGVTLCAVAAAMATRKRN